jgi:hypothetical protein
MLQEMTKLREDNVTIRERLAALTTNNTAGSPNALHASYCVDDLLVTLIW